MAASQGFELKPLFVRILSYQDEEESKNRPSILRGNLMLDLIGLLEQPNYS